MSKITVACSINKDLLRACDVSLSNWNHFI